MLESLVCKALGHDYFVYEHISSIVGNFLIPCVEENHPLKDHRHAYDQVRIEFFPLSRALKESGSMINTS